MCVCFSEHNEHEAETWNFYIDKEGNEEAIKRMQAKLAKHKLLDRYEFGDDIPLREVKILVKHSRSGYTRFERHLPGRLNLGDDFDEWDEEQLDDCLYKCGIEGFIEKWE